MKKWLLALGFASCLNAGGNKDYRRQKLELARQELELRKRELELQERRLALEERQTELSEVDVLLSHWQMYIDNSEADDVTQFAYATAVTGALHKLLVARIESLSEDQRGTLRTIIAMTPSDERDSTEWDEQARTDACTGLMRQLMTPTVDDAVADCYGGAGAARAGRKR